MNSSPRPGRSRVRSVSVVGAGRLGPVLARALAASGLRVHGPTGRGEGAEPADVVLLCVGDRDIAAAAAEHAGAGRWIGHTSGAASVAGTGVDFGLHPLQSVLGDEGPDAFAGVGCAIGARSDEALAVAAELAAALGAETFRIEDEQRAAYHAAASLASNFLVTIEDGAERVAAAAGLDAPQARRMLAPLVRRTVENWAARGPRRALTGPIVRGDDETLARQRAAVETGAPELLPLWDRLVERTRALAAREDAAT